MGAAIVALTLAVALPGPAEARDTKSGCTQLGGWKSDIVCVAVYGKFSFWQGKGLFVDKVRAGFTAPLGWPCNTKLYITFFDVNNRKYAQNVSSLHSGCMMNRDYTRTYGKTMRPGRVCGAVSIGGVLKPGACVSLFR